MKPAHRILAVLLALAAASCGGKRAPPGPPPPALVYVAPVVKRDVPLYVESVGALDGYDNADIRARVRGYLRSQAYKDGSRVKAGDLLFTIESTEYAAGVASARAALERARVARDRNRIQLERDQGLLKSGMISQQDLDNATASLADTEAQISSAQAQLDTASLNLSYTQIHSPIDGVAGLALVRIGNLVGQDGPTLLTTVSQTDPIRVNFSLSEVEYVRHPERFRHLEARDLAWARKQLAALDGGGTAEGGDPGVELALADGSVYPHRGVIVTTNRQIDAEHGHHPGAGPGLQPRRPAAAWPVRSRPHPADRRGARRAGGARACAHLGAGGLFGRRRGARQQGPAPTRWSSAPPPRVCRSSPVASPRAIASSSTACRR